MYFIVIFYACLFWGHKWHPFKFIVQIWKELNLQIWSCFGICAFVHADVWLLSRDLSQCKCFSAIVCTLNLQRKGQGKIPIQGFTKKWIVFFLLVTLHFLLENVYLLFIYTFFKLSNAVLISLTNDFSHNFRQLHFFHWRQRMKTLSEWQKLWRKSWYQTYISLDILEKCLINAL